jgi:hypothetical protein
MLPDGGTVYTRRQSQEERSVSELSTGLDVFKIFTAPADIGQKEALSLKKKMLDERHYTLMLDENGMVLTPDGQVVCILLKNRLQPDLLEAVRPIVRKAARQPVAGGNRADAAGLERVQRKLKDGRPSDMMVVPPLEELPDEPYQRLKPAKGGTFGYNARDVRGGQVYPCRLTFYSGALPEELGLMSELAKDVAEALRWSYVQYRWEKQFKKASQTPSAFLLQTPDGPTIFTTITCNNTWRTAAHVDKGDLKEGFGALCCLGDFEGCDLVFPRYKTAVRFREGDILLADVANQVHGNTPLLNPDGTVPKLDREPERLACVFYYEENMDLCLNSPEKEMDSVNSRKPGDPMYAKKKKS